MLLHDLGRWHLPDNSTPSAACGAITLDSLGTEPLVEGEVVYVRAIVLRQTPGDLPDIAPGVQVRLDVDYHPMGARIHTAPLTAVRRERRAA